VRTFIAIDLEPEVKTALQSLILTLKATGADVRWTQPGGLHLTLKFLGEVDEGQAAAVKKVVAEVAARHSAFPLRLEGTGAFPGDRNPRVLWAGFSAAPELLALHDELDGELEGEGFACDNRAFHPHLTLGRVKGSDRVRNALLELEKHQQETFGNMTVRKLTLFESRLRPDGAEYRALAEFGLL
jgi:2'-5' RNA ligase